MNAREMVYSLQDQLYNLYGDLIYEIKTVDLLYYLNKSQNQLIKAKVPNFEINEYLRDELRTLVKETSTPLVPVGNATKVSIDLPNDYNILVKHYCTTNNDCGVKRVSGFLTQLDDLEVLLKDPFWKPTSEEPIYYIINNKIVYEIPDSSFTITSSILTYIKKEQQIIIDLVTNTSNVDSELPDYLHEEIVDRARELIINDKQLEKQIK